MINFGTYLQSVVRIMNQSILVLTHKGHHKCHQYIRQNLVDRIMTVSCWLNMGVAYYISAHSSRCHPMSWAYSRVPFTSPNSVELIDPPPTVTVKRVKTCKLPLATIFIHLFLHYIFSPSIWALGVLCGLEKESTQTEFQAGARASPWMEGVEWGQWKLYSMGTDLALSTT